MTNDLPKYYHLHLVSDSTGDTLVQIAKAVTVQYSQMRALEHIHSQIVNSAGLKQVMREIASAPGLVLYTIIDKSIARELNKGCGGLGVPCIPVLNPIMEAMESYLGLRKTHVIAGQHVLDRDYYRRIDALNFALQHDDGMDASNLSGADIILLGATRTSKTPTTIYLANRGYLTANLPVKSGQPLPDELFLAKDALIAGLVASPDQILSYVQTKRQDIGQTTEPGPKPKREEIAADIEFTRELCADHDWPVVDISARSIEDTAAEILRLYREFADAQSNPAT